MTLQRVLAVDPGRDKCGVAAVDIEQGPLCQQIVAPNELFQAIASLARKYDCRVVALGNQTFSEAARQRLQPLIDQEQIDAIVMIDEHDSTVQARLRYWQANPPGGWRRFLPIGLLVPPCAIDDFAAIILGERYFEKNI
ncbi:MAG: Holliday junction resolvase YqgF [Firmicutes bacterium]|nr:Holliday junction resolvase YqgF [Bacillota bacterium]